MTKFFIYLEKILENIDFFNNTNILNQIDEKDFLSKNEKIKKLKNEMLEKGNIFVYSSKNNPHFNFKIGDIIYELVFMKSYSQNFIKLGDKLSAMQNKVDPKVAGRYGIIFYPRNIPGVKYGNVKLKPEHSNKLFEYIKICGESNIVNNKKFYFDGAYTEKENKILKKLEKVFNDIKQEIGNDFKNKNKIYEIFLNKLKEVDISLKEPILDNIKKIIKKDNFNKMLEKIAFIMRDELNINFNTREKYFVRLLKKEGIKATIGNKYTRTIFFDL